MIDVVFQLIIFFLVASHLARQETQVQVDLPAAASGLRDEEQPEFRRVVVNVLPGAAAERRVQVGGRLFDQEELSAMLQFESRRGGRDLEVRIRSDRRMPYRAVEPILLACARAGVWNVSFAVVEAEGSRVIGD
jgi:biopolymer transport protein ExbD